MSRDDIEQTIFGGFDGLSSAVGLVAGLVLAHQTASVVKAGVALAAAAAVSMAAGEWLSDPVRSMRRALVMGLATLVGSIAPALPFFFGTSWAYAGVSITITALCGALIAELRPGSRLWSFLVTYGVLIVASAAAIGAAALASGVGS